jgi:hypothetical protein
MCPFYGGKCLSRKAVYSCVEKFSQGHLKVADDAQPGAEVTEAAVKDFYAAGFDALVKRWDECINVGGGYVEKYMFFPGSNITCLYPFVTYLLTLSLSYYNYAYSWPFTSCSKTVDREN